MDAQPFNQTKQFTLTNPTKEEQKAIVDLNEMELVSNEKSIGFKSDIVGRSDNYNPGAIRLFSHSTGTIEGHVEEVMEYLKAKSDDKFQDVHQLIEMSMELMLEKLNRKYDPKRFPDLIVLTSDLKQDVKEGIEIPPYRYFSEMQFQSTIIDIALTDKPEQLKSGVIRTTVPPYTELAILIF